MINRRRALAVGGAGLAAGCAGWPTLSGGVERRPFGTLPDGQPVDAFTLRNRRGSSCRIITYGATVTSLRMPDARGWFADVVLGLDTLEDYRLRNRNFGATIGRFAGRIRDGRFVLDGQTVRLDTGGAPHASHGGPVGFARRNWAARIVDRPSGAGLELSLVSADGDQGFPGELTFRLIYSLTDDDRLTLEFNATTSRPTVLNPTHHSYFNLSGEPGSLVLDHDLLIEADVFTPYDASKFTTGEFRPIEGTPLDFRQPKPIGRDLHRPDEQMRIGNGYDHALRIRGEPGQLRCAARLAHAPSGRTMELWTTEPGVQLYTANSVDQTGRGGALYKPYCGVCLEPQHFQDSPNRPEFPSTVLRPGQVFRSRSEYRFGVLA